jgi:rod shape-determining protein MreB
MLNSLIGLFSRDIGIDLGTANTLCYVRGRGVVLREPSVVAIDTTDDTVVAVGDDAKRMIGRTPGNIRAIRPIKDGVIADFDVTEAMLREFISKVHNRTSFIRPRVVICTPSGVTSVEKKAVKDATIRAGAREAYLIEEPMAAAIGAGLHVHEPTGSMVVDIGGGTTEVGVISLGGIVYGKSIRCAGDEMDNAIIQHVKKKYNLLIGERTAEEIKITLGSARVEGKFKDDPKLLDDEEQEKKRKELARKKTGKKSSSGGDSEKKTDDTHPVRRNLEVRGRDLITGLPKTVTLSGEDAQEALIEPTRAIVGAVKTALELTPPELASDIIENGLTLTGGGALLKDLNKLVTAETGVRCYFADDPLTCVVRGTGVVLEELDTVRRSRAILK